MGSFYPAKNLGAFGDAGAIVTADTALADRIRSLRDHGRTRFSRYQHELVGTNSRLDALQALVLTAEEPGSRGAYHLAVALVPDRAEVQRQLAAAGIETQIHYPIPCHLQAPYRRFAACPLPVAERAASHILSLPIFPHMAEQQATLVCETMRDALAATGACLD